MSERTSSASPAMINLIIENDGTGNTIVGDDYIYGIFKFFRTPNGSKTSGIFDEISIATLLTPNLTQSHPSRSGILAL